MATYILLFQCRDKRGIVAKVSDLIFRNGGNILDADQHTTDPGGGHFFMRIEFSVEGKADTLPAIESDLVYMAAGFDAAYKLYDKGQRLRMGILVSKPDHCLVDLLYLWKAGELAADIRFVISNYKEHKETVEQYKIPFYYIPAAKSDRKESEILSLASGTDLLVLARYMLVLSPDFLRRYAKDIINIHHGFLPSFKGPDPYRQAFDTGVKVIGATAHFVTEALDEGPIIAQAVESVSHRDDIKDLHAKGRSLEKRALSMAVRSYLEHRIIKFSGRTVVF